MIGDAESEHRGIAEPERQAGQKADLGDVDRVQPPGGIDAVAHRAAGEDAGADIVPDRIAGEGGERVDAVGNVGAADRAHREQVIEGQGEIAGGHEQRRQRDLARLGLLDGLDHLVDVDAAQHVVEHVASDPDDRDADRQHPACAGFASGAETRSPCVLLPASRPRIAIPRRRRPGELRRRAPRLLPGTDVVARFGPEWNSLDVNKNKTRTFNILGEV